MTDTIITTPLPLDLEGVLSSNYIRGEQHTLAAGVNRLIIPRLGCFYSTKDLVVRESITGRVLIPVVDYVPVMYHKEASERSGLETMAAIIVTNPQVDSAVTVDLRYVGGRYTSVVDILFELIANLNLDNRSVRWGDLLGKPHAFTPVHHLHDIGDIYGFEYVVEAVDRCTRAVLYGDQAAFDEMRQWVNLKDAELHARIDTTNANLNSHVNNTSNPHATTKAQVGLGLVQNYGLSTQAQMLGTLQATSYVTPLAMTYYFQTGNGKPITDHLVNTNNPHSTTKAQVGLGSVENYGISDQASAETGTSNILYMTPLRVKQAITLQAVTPLNAHIARTDNPHATTKAQVGLGSVEDYPISSTAEATAGTVSNRYMTPLRVKEAITAQAVTPLNAHIARTDNPHATTKAQVGLGSVENYGIATTAEAVAGTVNTEYMTPLRVKEAITSQAVTPLNAHIARTDNPHSVTKAQVGLGNADNTSDVNKPVSTAQQNALNLKVDKVTGYALSKNDFTDALLSKLNGIAAGAQVNVPTNLGSTANASNVTVSSSTGSGTVFPAATQSNAGTLSAADKAKLDGIQAGAQVNVGTNLSVGQSTVDAAVYSSTGSGVNLPRASASGAGIVTAAYIQKIDSIQAGAQVNVPTNLSYGADPTNGYMYSSTGATGTVLGATTSYAGLLSASDKAKLNGIQAGAQVNVGTNLSAAYGGSNVTLYSSTGGAVAIAAATTGNAGVMTATQVQQLNSLLTGGGNIVMFVAWLGTGSGNSTPSIQRSSNVSSITRISQGRYRINYLNSIANTNYAVFGFASDNDASGDGTVSQQSSDTRPVNSLNVSTNVNGFDARDLPYVSVMAVN
jgi:hypothetical protein